ncbi:pre-peptidase C-terminal domain-containing protein [Paucibacter sp. DJ1R-11]|uniref:pre-peptidase C-terminal domain-containing protein n=1 Tax=Paucibacter sp. DJ1R-11 TaxID=2893556 RepID=UPI0021E3C323|nr:pre-peptidase C-terminal domain-containing protein [Paucibacter sp. DJ1R-11]MCV2364465.1 pre-peptidase C-terminal domain-containing protein [Paucibacter sp. DJ1R-11]
MHAKTILPLATLLALSALSSSSLAQDSTANVLNLGTGEQLIDALRQQHRGASGPFFRTLGSESLAVQIQDFFDKNGLVSISGHALGNSNSVFFLKGSAKSLGGYLALHDKRMAFEFSTGAVDGAKGQVTVREVPYTKVFPDFEQQFQRDYDRAQGITALAVAAPVYSPMALRQAPHIGPYANQDVTKLESKPGSPWVFYLNTTAVMSGSTPLNGVSKEQMYRAWQSVADQYSMLNMNVTTNRAVYDAARTANTLRTGIINFVNQDGRSFAPLRSFGTTSAGTLYRNPSAGFDYGYGIGMTGAHEVGHQMGMSHDGGGSGGEYFEGIAAYQWGPIMGNYWMGGSWANQLFTWSRGEYSTANNQEDDFRIMTVNESVPYVADDNASGKPLQLRAGGEINPLDNWGQIERNTDSDVFSFNVATAGTLNLRVDPIEYLRMLDVDAVILNGSGQQVARSNLSVNRSAEFKNLALAAGSYQIKIQGGAEGTPQNGFSNYSSVGYYALKGSLTGGVPDTPPTPLSSGVPLANQSAATGSWTYYAITLPSAASKLTVTLQGGNGDADLFVQKTAKPSTSSYACKSDGSTSNESCAITAPAAATYIVGVQAYAAYSGVTITATVTP